MTNGNNKTGWNCQYQKEQTLAARDRAFGLMVRKYFTEDWDIAPLYDPQQDKLVRRWKN